MHDGADAAVVVASSGHGQVAKVKLNEILHFASLNVEHHGVVHLCVQKEAECQMKAFVLVLTLGNTHLKVV